MPGALPRRIPCLKAGSRPRTGFYPRAGRKPYAAIYAHACAAGDPLTIRRRSGCVYTTFPSILSWFSPHQPSSPLSSTTAAVSAGPWPAPTSLMPRLPMVCQQASRYLLPWPTGSHYPGSAVAPPACPPTTGSGRRCAPPSPGLRHSGTVANRSRKPSSSTRTPTARFSPCGSGRAP